MALYYKNWLEQPQQIPETAIILDQKDLADLKDLYGDPISTFCIEAEGINRIRDNEDGYFDFNKNLIDIGACLGEYCWLLPFNHSYAFEPNKLSRYKMITNLVSHDRVYDVDIYDSLLSDNTNPIIFNGWNTIDDDSFNYKEMVTPKTLDSFNFENIGLIKVDVEMMEEQVLRGGIGTIIRNNYPPIIFECFLHNKFGMTEEKRQSLFRFIESLGYTIKLEWIDFETHLAIKEN